MIAGIDEKLTKIESLVKQKGFIYSLLMIIIEDIYCSNIHQLDNQVCVSINELRLIIGFLVKSPIDLSYPTIHEVLETKKLCRRLLRELHQSWTDSCRKNPLTFPEFIKSENGFTEMFFYSGLGTDFYQIFKYYEDKYKNYKDILNKNYNFKLIEFKDAFFQIKDALKNKIAESVLSPFDKKLAGNAPQELHDVLEISIYRILLIDAKFHGNENKFFDDLLNLFTLNNNVTSNDFLDFFSFEISEKTNENFNTIGDRNIIYEKPIIKLADDKYLVLDIYLLAESLYEQPHMKLLQNKSVCGEYGKFIGDFFEDQVLDLLRPLFSTRGIIYKNVDMYKGSQDRYTDIDVLVMLDNRAVIFQVKSKGLTTKSKSGDCQQIVKDFKLAIGDAYGQALKSKEALLNQDLFQLYSNNELISLNSIEHVDIVLVTAANYPALAIKTPILLDIPETEKSCPVSITLFQLEFIVHFLKNDYEFLHYINQRAKNLPNNQERFLGSMIAESELVYLGYYILDNLVGDLVMNLDNSVVDPLNEEFEVCKQDNKATNDNKFYLTNNLKKICDKQMLDNNPQRLDNIFKALDKKHITHNKKCITRSILRNPLTNHSHHKQGRNEKCNCGSGIKYKKCCGRN